MPKGGYGKSILVPSIDTHGKPFEAAPAAAARLSTYWPGRTPPPLLATVLYPPGHRYGGDLRHVLCCGNIFCCCLHRSDSCAEADSSEGSKDERRHGSDRWGRLGNMIVDAGARFFAVSSAGHTEPTLVNVLTCVQLPQTACGAGNRTLRFERLLRR